MNIIISPRYAGLVFSALMALSMSVPMSAVMLIVNGGLELGWDAFLLAWARAAGTGFIVALPIASFVSPRIRKMTAWLTQPDGE
jgi:hypothetical protein